MGTVTRQPGTEPSPTLYGEASKHQVEEWESPSLLPAVLGSVPALSWKGWGREKKRRQDPGKLLFVHFFIHSPSIFSISLSGNRAHKQKDVKYQCKADPPVITNQDPWTLTCPLLTITPPPPPPPELTRICLLEVSITSLFLGVSASPNIRVPLHLLLTLPKWDHAIQSVCHAICLSKLHLWNHLLLLIAVLHSFSLLYRSPESRCSTADGHWGCFPLRLLWRMLLGTWLHSS